MTLRKLGQTQTSLGVLVLLFTGLLFAGTSFVFWIVGNLIYSLASIHAGTLFHRKNRNAGRAFALVGLLIFAASNAAVAATACGHDGACGFVLAVPSVVVPVLLALLFLSGRVDPRDA